MAKAGVLGILHGKVLESVQDILPVILGGFGPLNLIELLPQCLHEPFLKSFLCLLVLETQEPRVR